MMSSVSYEKLKFFLNKNRGDTGNIGQMSSASVGIVEDNDISINEFMGFQSLLDRQRHGSEMNRNV